MHWNFLLVVGITILFLGLAIQPSIATPQLKKIDVEPDVEGLVAQIRIVINEILQDYGHIPIVRSLCNKITNTLDSFGQILYCIFLIIILIPMVVLSLIFIKIGLDLLWIGGYFVWITAILLFEYDIECRISISNGSKSPLQSLSNINRLYAFDDFTLTGFDECPCMQE